MVFVGYERRRICTTAASDACITDITGRLCVGRHGAGDAGAVLNKADGAKPTERRSAFGRLSLKSASDRRNSKSTGCERKSSIGTRPDCADELPNHISYIIRLPCFDAVGWAAGRASGL